MIIVWTEEGNGLRIDGKCAPLYTDPLSTGSRQRHDIRTELRAEQRSCSRDQYRCATIAATTMFVLMLLCEVFACPSMCALSRDRKISQFYHSAWLARDGAPSQINGVAQTADGYLWFASGRGLFQFDGVQFKLYESPAGDRFPSNNINSLMATPDGALWISFNPSGIGVLKNGQFVLSKDSRFELASFVRDSDGRIWVGTATGLFLQDGNQWHEIAIGWNFTGRRIWAMFVDRSGTLWVAVDNTLTFLRRGSNQFQKTGAHFTSGVVRIAQAPNRQLWVSEYDSPLLAIDDEGRILKSPQIQLAVTNFLFDRNGSLWLVGALAGVCRLRFPERLGNRTVRPEDSELEWFKQEDGLTDNDVSHVFEDREGNIWITSSKGVNRFRYSYLVPIEVPQPSRHLTLVAGGHGDLWIGTEVPAPVRHIQGDDLLPNATRARVRLSSVYRESGGTIWWGGRALWRQLGDRLDSFNLPAWVPAGWIWEVFPDDRNGGLWVSSGDFGLVHFKDGVWTLPPKLAELPDYGPSASFHEAAGRTWLGYRDGRAFLLTRAGVRIYSPKDGLDIGRIRVIRGHGAHMFFGGELGLAVLGDGRFTTIRTAGDRSLGAVTGIVEAADGSLWLNEQHGIVCFSPADVLQLFSNPEHIAQAKVYDFLDGLPGAAETQFRSSTAVQTSDGRLWFATDNGLAWVDPNHMLENSISPPVLITSLNTDSKQYAAPGVIRLPKRTTTVRIEYTALSFSIPERVHFKYMLQGVDLSWHDAGNLREAVYNNLGPGPYSFRVVAANNDGVWNTKGTTLQFSIAPAWFQTIWFRALCVVAFFGLVWSLYWIRLRQVQSNERNLSLIVDTIPGLVLRMSAAGEVELANRQLLAYFGKELEDIRNWASSGVVHPEDLPRAIEIAGKAFATGDPYDMEIRVRRYDGVYRWFQARGIPLRDAEGRILNWYALHTDIDDRKRVEEALRSSEFNARMIVDGIPGLVARVSPAGEVEVVNRPLLEYFGKDLEDVRNWAFTDAIYPDDLPVAMKVFNNSLPAGEPFDVEHRLRRFDGAYRWFQSRGLPLRDPDGRILNWYVLLTDIEDRKKAEEALLSNERNLGMIINTMPTLAWSARPDGSAEFLNQHYLDYIGLPFEKLQGWGWTSAVHPDDLKSLSGMWQSIMAAGKAGEAEARLRRFDGEYRWFLFRTNPMRDESGQIVKWYGTNTDIHDRKRAEAEVKESYLRLAEAQQLSKTGSFITDLVADQHKWSEETFRIFEFDPGTTVTVQMIREGIHPEDRPSFDSMIGRAMTGKDVDFSFRFLTSRGAVKHIRGMARVIEHVVGRPLFIGALQDVTESKVAEEALNRARSELAHVARVTTLNALTASIAHEINQPLSGIITNANTGLWLLSTDPPDVEGAREAAERTIRDGNRASDVIKRLRTLYSRKEFRPEAMNLNEATREIISLSLSDLRRNRIIVHQELADDLPAITGDRIQIQQVLLNLVRNASDAMSSIDDRARDLLIKTEREEGNSVRLSVTDGGVGFQAQTADRLFEAFFSTKADGMGIGLYLSRSIIEAHHGRLWGVANDGPGATFSFAIPCKSDGLTGSETPVNVVDGATG